MSTKKSFNHLKEKPNAFFYEAVLCKKCKCNSIESEMLFNKESMDFLCVDCANQELQEAEEVEEQERETEYEKRGCNFHEYKNFVTRGA